MAVSVRLRGRSLLLAGVVLVGACTTSTVNSTVAADTALLDALVDRERWPLTITESDCADGEEEGLCPYGIVVGGVFMDLVGCVGVNHDLVDAVVIAEGSKEDRTVEVRPVLGVSPTILAVTNYGHHLCPEIEWVVVAHTHSSTYNTFRLALCDVAEMTAQQRATNLCDIADQ